MKRLPFLNKIGATNIPQHFSKCEFLSMIRLTVSISRGYSTPDRCTLLALFYSEVESNNLMASCCDSSTLFPEYSFCFNDASLPQQNKDEFSLQQHSPKQSVFRCSTRLVSQTTTAKKNVMLFTYSNATHTQA